MSEQNKFKKTEYQKLLDTAMVLEKVALEDDYFKARNLYPNLDFYTAYPHTMTV